MKKTSKKAKPEHAGFMRNDLPGYMKLRDNKITVRWKGKDIATGCDNTILGWKSANIFWENKVKELIAIENGEKSKADTILNIFKKFLNYKKKITKIVKKTEQFYITGFNAVFKDYDKILNEQNIKKQLENFINTTTVATSTVNIYLKAVAAFLNWASAEDNNYIPPKKYIKKYKQKVVKRIKPSYTVEEYEQLLSFFQNNKNTEMFLLLQFLWHKGARVGETLTIKLSDIKLEKNCIFVPNKNYKGEQEALLLIPEAIKIVEQVRELAIQRGDNKLFSWKSGQLLNLMAVRAEEKLNIKIHARGLHGIRRAFCDRLFEKGLSIPEVQDIMRHRDIQTTINYYRSFKQQELVNKMSEKLKN